jgi:predicted metal-dependent HD superfamily phosphohydrolase
MKMPEYDRMKKYVFEKLEAELDSRLYYHGIQHTRDYVLPAVEHLAGLEHIEGERLILLLSAAVLHDIGYIRQYENNEVIGTTIVAELLPEFSYSPEQIEVVKAIIMATALPQTATNLLEKIMCDADLCHFGADNFMTLSSNLWRELIEFGYKISKKQWNESTLRFLSTHLYWTETAAMEWNKGKKENIEKLLEQIKTP